jgi:hypothetical protein
VALSGEVQYELDGFVLKDVPQQIHRLNIALNKIDA